MLEIKTEFLIQTALLMWYISEFLNSFYTRQTFSVLLILTNIANFIITKRVLDYKH